MSKERRVQLTLRVQDPQALQALNEQFLRVVALEARDGRLMGWALQAAKGRDIPTLLRDLSRAFPGGAISEEEASFVSFLLRFLAEGDDVRELLRIDAPPKIGHRKASDIDQMIVDQIEMKKASLGTYTQAYAAVAEIVKKSAGAVQQIHKRARKAETHARAAARVKKTPSKRALPK
jgi:hypothetical protein